jgi:hypothetical protein
VSAFQCPDVHIGALVKFALDRRADNRPRWRERRMEYCDGQDVFDALREENARSVAYRYDEPATLEVVEFTPSRYPTIGPVTCLKAIRCLEYQSCEHDGWDTSAAKRFLDELLYVAIRRLPGYEDAPAWCIGDGDVDPRKLAA